MDGNLRQLFQKHIPDFHWQAIETGSTGRGIPDLNFCAEGKEGWIELKVTSTQTVGLRPEQIGWLLRRSRAGGRAFVAVRFLHGGGPRKGEARDDLYIFQGKDAQWIAEHGLEVSLYDPAYRFFAGSPRSWDWGKIREVLLNPVVKIT